MEVSIRSINVDDAAGVAVIYNHYVSNTYFTFETEPVAVESVTQRISQTMNHQLPWLVAETEGGIVGYAHASKWKERFAYRYSVESTLYVAGEHAGQGIGLRLYSALIDATRKASMHSMVGGIALPNEPSVRLHERLGFRKVAHFEQVGYKLDRWIDVGYWQLLL